MATSLFTNHLAHEKSPYLLQHQHNPVDWYPWGPEAFEKARTEEKPIFLSIGYSTCHWCHVMAHESFESKEIASLMNELFVNVKVDREERPDVDRLYMAYLQATTGSGGWPMSVFLTPELKPFYGGTYFPPVDRYGRPGFPTVLKRLAAAWKDDRVHVAEIAEHAIDSLRKSAAVEAGAVSAPGEEAIAACAAQLSKSFDPKYGGFGHAPKFPHPVSLNLLFLLPNEGGKEYEPRAMALATLEHMSAGGIHDHLGGGFHRYSVDQYWHVPHFEKMLYDQALLAASYVDAFQLTQDPKCERIARGIFDYVLRDLTSSEGAFFSAEDADSLIVPNGKEHAEGAFYVWTKAEIETLLGADAAKLFCACYGVEADGNAPEGSDPQHEFTGKNILIRRLETAAAAKRTGLSEIEIESTLEMARKTLFEARAKRPRPHLDDKIITAWNGLMISALAKAAVAFQEPKYTAAAQKAAAFVAGKPQGDGLFRSFRDGSGSVPGFAEDYAFLIQGLLDLYEADFDTVHLQRALQFQKEMDATFWDAEHGGYFSASDKDTSILLRMKEDYDGAEPSPNSIAAANLQRIADITGNEGFRNKAEKTVAAFSSQLILAPSAMPQMLCAVHRLRSAPRQIVIAGALGATDTRSLLREVNRHYLPETSVFLADGETGQKWLQRQLPFMEEMKPLDGKAAAYICDNFACQRPVATVEELRVLLAAKIKVR